MQSGRSVLVKYWPWLLAIYSVFLMIFMNHWGVVESSEARYAEIAREMLVNGDWLHPRLLNIFHYHKPPFTYWITALGYSMFGVSTFGARFFLSLGVLAQIVLIYKIALHFLQDKEKAFAAALIYATMPLVLISVRGLTTDAYLQTFILLAIHFFLRWRETQQAKWLYLIAAAMGLGFLTKGPLILILPVFFLIGFNKSLARTSFTYHHILATLLFLAIGFSWFVFLIAENATFIQYFLFRHTYERMTNAEVFSRREPFWYYILYTPLVALPWMIIAIPGVIKEHWRDLPETIKRIALFLIVLPLTFFSISSSKLILYVLPAFPGIAILTAYFLFQINRISWSENIVAGYFFLVGLSFYFIRLFDQSLSMPFELWLPPSVMIISLLGVRRIKYLGKPDRVLLRTFIFTLFLLGYGARFMHHNELKINSTEPIVSWIKEQQLQHKPILVYNRLLPSLAFGLQKDILSLHDGNRYLNRETDFEVNDQWKEGLFDLRKPEDVARLKPLLETSPVLIVKGKPETRSEWLIRYFQHHHQLGDWVVYY